MSTPLEMLPQVTAEQYCSNVCRLLLARRWRDYIGRGAAMTLIAARVAASGFSMMSATAMSGGFSLAIGRDYIARLTVSTQVAIFNDYPSRSNKTVTSNRPLIEEGEEEEDRRLVRC
ncbi:hypothetical protein V8G54_034510 [Vigna mungo]|uniref:Uncharacterized protein n=1 Tax=Vigna mungo TaxID=3915 RepID=A0AAQ3MQM0_VIGMU